MPSAGSRQPNANPDQETRNDDPRVQEQREQKARGQKDQAEGERGRTAVEDERVPGAAPEEDPVGVPKRTAR